MQQALEVKEFEEISSLLDVPRIRQDFPILGEVFSSSKGSKKSLIYFDNAATTQKPKQVIDAIKNYYEHENANVHRAIHKLGERATLAYESSRETVAKFINEPNINEIVFTRGTTEAINLVASSWGRKFIKPGDEILLSEMEHHSNLIPWQILAKEKDIKLRFIPFSKEKGTLNISHLDSLMNEKSL